MTGSGGAGPDLSTRSLAAERLDAPDLDPDDLARSLAEVARVNRVLGGLRSLRRHLRPLVDGRSSVRLLDVGVGNGGVTHRLARELRDDGVRVRWVGLDLSLAVLRVARTEVGGEEPGGTGLVRGDAARLPFANDSFDVSTATLTLHHMPDAACRTVLSEMARVSRTAVLVSDLERTRLHWLGARILSATLWRRDPVTRHDAPLSVRRSFTRGELERLAADAPFRSSVVRRYFPFRLLLEGRP